jgi:hypothetical protein
MLAAALAGRVEHRLQQFPLVIGQVTWVRHAPHSDHAPNPRNRDIPSNSRPVIGLVDSPNGFGALMRNSYECKVRDLEGSFYASADFAD